MRKTIIISLLLCIAAAADAQTFIDRLQKKTAGQGSVTVTQDAEITNLVNGLKTATAPAKKTNTTPNTATEKNTAGKSATEKSTTSPTESGTNAATGSETTDRIVTRSRKVTGYRVQAFAGGNTRQDRQNAERTGNRIKAAFPNEAIYVHFYSPRWICRVGNYKTYEEAHRMLQAIQELGYKQASIVKGKIIVQY